eukprot:1392428-Amorphochlora_amoeboformis.AAC.2
MKAALRPLLRPRLTHLIAPSILRLRMRLANSSFSPKKRALALMAGAGLTVGGWWYSAEAKETGEYDVGEYWRVWHV